MYGGIYERPFISWTDHPLLRIDLWFDQGLRKLDGGKEVNILYVITGVIALALFVYLVLALLKPEWFG